MFFGCFDGYGWLDFQFVQWQVFGIGICGLLMGDVVVFVVVMGVEECWYCVDVFVVIVQVESDQVIML